ncbi:MAG: hypothetical protein JWO92_207 [Chitinophagaceae bacterium]|nr:hypothetical protein [Chitinophagaceae bacterium]MDB5223104.1 hypothetical protein [Chitinophagaceae bacterium]
MRTKSRHTVVIIPNNKKLEVSYYTSDLKLKEKEKKDFTDLIIQLHDCHSSIKISKEKIKDAGDVEAIVQKTVINARGHLCD